MSTSYIKGDDRVMLMISGIPAMLRPKIAAVVSKFAIDVTANTKLNLNGPSPQFLNVSKHGGKLRRSITYKMDESAGAIKSVVGTPLDYGRFWEEGFDRKIGAGARGGPRILKGKSLETYIAKHPPGTKHYDARPFLKPALYATTPSLAERLAKIGVSK